MKDNDSKISLLYIAEIIDSNQQKQIHGQFSKNIEKNGSHFYLYPFIFYLYPLFFCLVTSCQIASLIVTKYEIFNIFFCTVKRDKC
jgi:hypothetical protein